MSYNNGTSYFDFLKYLPRSFLCLLSTGIVTTVALVACGTPSASLRDSRQWQSNGSMMISRPLPNLKAPGLTHAVDGSSALGFAPQQTEESWMSIETTAGTITVHAPNGRTYKTNSEGVTGLKAGSYKLLHKQRNPLWYAPDSYFQSRQLTSPPAGDKARYRRGALGEYVLFIDQNTPLHCSPVYSPDVGGIKVKDAELSRIYYMLAPGSRIEVR